MTEPPLPLDLDAIEARAAAWLADPYWAVRPTEQLISADLPALLARVRALEAENRKLQTRLWNKLAGVDVE